MIVNSIINFYRENGNEYMGYENPNQIKGILDLLNANDMKFKNANENNIEDPLYYIDEPKKIIKFNNSNYETYKVKVPISITMYDLYSIAQKYKYFTNNINQFNDWKHSNILLVHKYNILNKNEPSIKSINNNDSIIIIEPRNFPDDSYYNSLFQRKTNKKNVRFKFQPGKEYNMVFPEDIKVSEIYKAFSLKFGIDNKFFSLRFRNMNLQQNDESTFVFINWTKIYVYENNKLIGGLVYKYGKVIHCNIFNNDKKKVFETKIGILNSTKILIYFIEEYTEKKIKNIKIGNKENKQIKKGDLRSLYSLGINEDFDGFLETEN